MLNRYVLSAAAQVSIAKRDYIVFRTRAWHDPRTLIRSHVSFKNDRKTATEIADGPV